MVVHAWKNLPEEKKGIYIEMAQRDKDRFEREMVSFEEKDVVTERDRNRCDGDIITPFKSLGGNRREPSFRSRFEEKQKETKTSPVVELECVVCFDSPKGVMLKPCRHVATCAACAKALDPQLCPICRASIETIESFFLA